jgi:hypothetical protein
MQRVLGLAIATFAFSSLSGAPAVATVRVSEMKSGFDQGRQRVPIDIAALLTAAKGAPPMMPACASSRFD